MGMRAFKPAAAIGVVLGWAGLLGAGPQATAAEVGTRLRPLVQRSYRLKVVRGRAYVATTVGLRILDVRRMRRPRLLSTLVVPGSVNDVAVWTAPAPRGRRGATRRAKGPAFSAVAFLAAGPYGLVVADVSDPRKPRRVARLDTRGSANGVARGSDLLFVADGSAGVVAVDVRDPRHPRVRAIGPVGCYAWSVAVHGRWLYVACGRDGLRVFPLERRRGRALFGKPVSYKLSGSVRGFAWGPGRTLYVAAGEAGVHVMDGRRPRRLRVVSTAKVGDFARGVSAWGALLAVAGGESGVSLFDCRRRNRPVRRALYRTRSTRSAIGVQLRRNRVYVAYDHAGVHLLEVGAGKRLLRRAVFTFVKPPVRPQGTRGK